MKLKDSNNLLLLTGKVVQIFDITDEKVAKIFLEPDSVNLTFNTNEEVSLGDTISIEASVSENSIKIISSMPGIL